MITNWLANRNQEDTKGGFTLISHDYGRDRLTLTSAPPTLA